MKPDKDITDPRIAKALAHPLRVRILNVLDERVASPSEIAAELDADLGVVSYHVRKLQHLGLLKLVRRKQRRGAIEHFYKSDIRPVVRSDVWGRVPGIVKKAMVGATVSQVADVVSAAVQSGGFERSEAHLTRSPVVLDQRGFSELATKLDGVLADIERIGAASEKRLAKAQHEGEIRATAVLMLFESEEPTGAASDAAKPHSARRSRARASV
jgi:DNA-binding transcriptional ArsR family regulator